MALRLIHSADWHLGQTLHGHDRTEEHARFLHWLAALLGEVEADVLVVAGDVFDSPNPPVSAQRALFHFLMAARQQRPGLQVVITAGNHDGAARLEAPGPLLAELGVQVVGLMPRDARGQVDAAGVVLPLRDRTGQIAAWCVAMPFLRPSDLPAVPVVPGGRNEPSEEGEADSLAAAVAALYEQAFTAARRRQEPGQALIAMGHASMAGGEISDLSERRILCGGLHALPVALFPEDVAYTALGHLHKAQRVGGREAVRYSGSPLPLALSEDTYRHQVVQVDIEGSALQAWTAIPVPRSVDILRLPAEPRAPRLRPEALAQAVATLPEAARSPLPPERWPFLELRVGLDAPNPGLSADVGQLLDGRAVRLARLDVRLEGTGAALAETVGITSLDTLTPEAVFTRCWDSRYGQTPPPPIQALFQSLLVAETEGEAGGGDSTLR